MKLTVATKAFRVAVEEAGRCVENKTTIPILANIGLISDLDTGTLRVIGTDLEVGRIETIDAIILEPDGVTSITVPKALLKRYLQSCRDQELRIETDLDFHVRVNEAQFNGMSMESFPELPAVPDTPVADLRLDYLSLMLRRGSVAISSEENRFTLNGALLELENKLMRVVSTDGHRMMLQEAVRPDDGTFHALVPKFACMELGAVKSKAFGVRLYADDNHLWFCWGNSQFIARKLTGTFPDYRRVMVKQGQQGCAFAADQMLATVTAALPFADDRSRALRFTFNGACTVQADVVERGAFSREVPLLVSPAEPVTLGFDGKYVAELLQHCKGQTVGALFSFHPSAAVPEKLVPGASLWQPVQESGPSLQYTLMPMRI